MNKFFTFLILIFISVTVSAQKYVQVWGDEFNTPGLPDSTKWSFEKGKLRNNELQYYTVKRTENARIEDSVLIIEARKEKYDGADYTSASIISKGIGDWKYGKFEIRAKVPGGKGTWPAIWMMPTYSEYGGWPSSGELDIMEYIGVEPQNIYFTSHFKGINMPAGQHGSSGSGPQKVVRDPFNNFITFTVVWTPEKIEWWANDRKYHEYKKPADDYRVWPFDKEFYMILNLAYGGNWAGSAGVDDTKLPHKFMIDYIRVYQLQDTESPFTLDIATFVGGQVEISPKMDFYPEGTEVTLTAVPDKSFEFKAWKHQSSTNPFTFKINKNTTILPFFKDLSQLLTNGTFDKTSAPWSFYVHDSNNSAFTTAIEDGKFAVIITKSPGVDWHLGFQESGFAMPKGKYMLSFDAFADQAKTMTLSVSKNYVDWSAIISKSANITTINKHFEIPMEMVKDDENVRLYFGIGNFTGKFHIDNIKLSRTDISTLINESSLKKGDLRLFPNPAGNTFSVQLAENLLNNSISLEMFDAYGKLVLKRKQLSNSEEIDISGFTTGLYIVKVVSGKYSFSDKLLISK